MSRRTVSISVCCCLLLFLCLNAWLQCCSCWNSSLLHLNSAQFPGIMQTGSSNNYLNVTPLFRWVYFQDHRPLLVQVLQIGWFEFSIFHRGHVTSGSEHRSAKTRRWTTECWVLSANWWRSCQFIKIRSAFKGQYPMVRMISGFHQRLRDKGQRSWPKIYIDWHVMLSSHSNNRKLCFNMVVFMEPKLL